MECLIRQLTKKFEQAEEFDKICDKCEKLLTKEIFLKYHLTKY